MNDEINFHCSHYFSTISKLLILIVDRVCVCELNGGFYKLAVMASYNSFILPY